MPSLPNTVSGYGNCCGGGGGGTNIDIKDLDVVSITAETGNIKNLVCESVTTTDLTAENGDITNLTSENATITNLTSDNGVFVDLTAQNGNITNLTSDNGVFVDFTAQNGTITNLTSTDGDITNLTSANATITQLDTDEVNAKKLTTTGKPGTVKFINRDLTICDANGNGNSGTTPNTGYDPVTVWGPTLMNSQLQIKRKTNPGSLFEAFGACLEISNQYSLPKYNDFGARSGVLTMMQLGHDYIDPYSAIVSAFNYYGAGDYRNSYFTDVNSNISTTTPSFVMQMPAEFLSVPPYVMRNRVYNDNLVGKIVNMNYYYNGVKPIVGMTITVKGATPSSLDITNAIITQVDAKAGNTGSITTCCDVYYTTTLVDVVQSTAVNEVRIGPKISAAGGIATVTFPNGPRPNIGQGITVNALPATLNVTNAEILDADFFSASNYTNFSTLTYAITSTDTINMTSLVSYQLKSRTNSFGNQIGNLCNIGIHTSFPEAPLDIVGDIIVRDLSTRRSMFRSQSEKSTDALIQFLDASRSTNYSMADFDMYNGTITFRNPVDAVQFFYLNNVTKKATFSSDATTPFFEVDAINSTVKIYPALTTVPFAEFNCSNNTFNLYNSSGLQFIKFDSTNQVATYNRTTGGGAAFAIFDAGSAKCAIGNRATEGLAYSAANTSLTGTVAVIYGSLRVLSIDTSNYCDLYIGMAASQNLFRTQTSTTQIMMGTSTPTSGALLTVAGNISCSGTINSSVNSVDKKNGVTVTGVNQIGSDPTLISWFKLAWGANTTTQTISHTVNGTATSVSYAETAKGSTTISAVTYGYFRAFTTTASQQWRSSQLYSTSTGAYTGTVSTSFTTGSAATGEWVGAQTVVGTTNIYMLAQSIVFTAPLVTESSGTSKMKEYTIYGYRADENKNYRIYDGTTSSTLADETITITASTSSVSNMSMAFSTFAIIVKSVYVGVAPTTGTYSAAVSSFYISGYRSTTPLASSYFPNSIEVGIDPAITPTLSTSIFKVNGDSQFNGFINTTELRVNNSKVDTTAIQNMSAVSGTTTVTGNLTTGTLNVSSMASATTTSMLYYDTSSKLVTYGAVPGGGSTSSTVEFGYLNMSRNSANYATGYTFSTVIYDSGSMGYLTGASYNPVNGELTLPAGYFVVSICGFRVGAASGSGYIGFGQTGVTGYTDLLEFYQKTFAEPSDTFNLTLSFVNTTAGTKYKTYFINGATTTAYILGTGYTAKGKTFTIMKVGEYVAPTIIVPPTLTLGYSTTGTAAVSTTQSVIGAYSLNTPGASTNRVNIENFPATTYLSSNWTLEFFLYVPSQSTAEISPISFSNNLTSASSLVYPAVNCAQSRINWYVGSSSAVTWNVTNAAFNMAISLAKWNHVALVYTLNTKYDFYCNGSLVQTVSNTTTNVGPLLTCINLGSLRVNNNQVQGGYGSFIDGLRISKTQRYTGSTYTIPIEYIVDANTVYTNNFDNGAVIPT